ncbi:Guanine nucleotide exchange factor lte1 [Blastocladiella emersonii ATCC 22665]|nr:Guanine nucleotide exchange factor lte1 [Blastocladiella emersonii ATCC 22665]
MPSTTDSSMAFRSPLFAHLAQQGPSSSPSDAQQSQSQFPPRAHRRDTDASLYDDFHSGAPEPMTAPGDASFRSDFMTPLLPRELQLLTPEQAFAASLAAGGSPVPAGSMHQRNATSTSSARSLAAAAHSRSATGAPSIAMVPPSPPLAHAPLQPTAAGVHHAKEFEYLSQIYGWLGSPALGHAAPADVAPMAAAPYAQPMHAASSANLAAAAKFGTYQFPSASDAGMSPATAASPSSSGSGSSGWSSFLNVNVKLPSWRRKRSSEDASTASPLRASNSAPRSNNANVFDASSLASGTTHSGASSRYSASSRDSREAAFPDRDDASFTSFTVRDEPTVVVSRPRAGSFTSVHDRSFSNPDTVFAMANDSSVLVAGSGEVLGTTAPLPSAATHISRGLDVETGSFTASGYARPEHRRVSSDRTIHSVLSFQTQSAQPIGSSAPASEIPEPVPISIHRHDSGFHLVDSGIHRQSAAPSENLPLGPAFGTYRLTCAPPMSSDSFNSSLGADDDESDDEETAAAATVIADEQPAPALRPFVVVPPRTTSAKPSGTLASPQSPAPPTPATQAPAPDAVGDFGLPPDGHPFWTNPRIFDPAPPTSTSAKGAVPPVVWEVNPSDNKRRLMAACPVALIEVLTTTLDYQFLTDFFLVYRCFMTPLQLALLLILRFRWAMLHPDSEEHALVRFRTFIVLRHWINEYYVQDFAGSRALRYLMIVTFVNEITEDPVIRAHPRDYRLIKTLKRLLRAQDTEYKHLKALAQAAGAHGDLASWVHQMSVEKHFESVYYPILMEVKKGSSGGSSVPPSPSTSTAAAESEDDTASRDSGIARSGSTGSRSFVLGRPASGDVRGSTVSIESHSSTTSSVDSGTGDQAAPGPLMTGSAACVPAALTALVCTKRSFLLRFKIEAIAAQFQLIEEMMLLSIPWPALLAHTAAAKPVAASPAFGMDRGPVQSMIDRFNTTCQWVATEVLTQRSTDERVKVIEKLIRLAVKSHHLGNYSTVNQIALGLQNPYVERLKKTWSKVSTPEKKQFRDLVALTAPMKNFAPLRAAMAGELERGCGIPFTGVLLSDLVYNREMAAQLGKTTLAVSGAGAVSLPVINYHKFRVMAGTLDQFRQFQRCKRPPQHYNLDVNIYANCLCLRTLANDELQRLSYECERK